jgi:hypothetical protein
MEPSLVWTIVGAVAGIIAIPVTIWGVRKSTSPNTDAVTSRDARGLPRRKRCVICVNCSRRLVVRLRHGTAGVLDCPKCSRPITVELLADGRMAIGDATGVKLTYRARNNFLAIFWHLSDMKYRSSVIDEWEDVPEKTLAQNLRRSPASE